MLPRIILAAAGLPSAAAAIATCTPWPWCAAPGARPDRAEADALREFIASGPPLTLRRPLATIPMRADGTLKILQFADMHYNNGKTTKCSDLSSQQQKMGPCSDLNTTQFLDLLLTAEKPDLIIFTGDNIDGGANDARTAVNDWASVCNKHNVPWAGVEGNHDQQSTMTRKVMMETLVAQKGSVSEMNPDNIKDTLYGYGNYYLSVTKPGGGDAFHLYMFDSGDSSKVKGVSGYDWIHSDQVAWYLNTSLSLKANKTGAPGLAFFHIPMPEYPKMLAAKVPISGQNQEAPCPPTGGNDDSGLFSAFLEAGDVKMVNVGHDHANDFCGNWYGVDLCYAGGAGFHAYGRAGWPRRARLIHLSADGTIQTWKRTDPWLGKLAIIDKETIWSPSLHDVSHPLRRGGYPTAPFMKDQEEDEEGHPRNEVA